MSSTTFIGKLSTVLVVLLMLFVVAIPAVSAITTKTVEEDIDVNVGTNTILPYVETISQSVEGNMHPYYEIVRCDFNGRPDTSGDYILINQIAFIAGETFYISDSSQFKVYGDGAEVIGSPSNYDSTSQLVFNGWSIYFEHISGDPQGILRPVVSQGENAYEMNMIIPYNVSYSNTVQGTYGANTIQSTTISSIVGDMNGTTFTPNTNGDWLQIPLSVLNNSNQTYKVADGATYYAPDANNDLAAFTAPSTTGVNSAVTITFTQDQAISSATVYNVVVLSVDTDLSPVIISKDVTVTSRVAITGVETVTTGDACSFFINDSGELYGTGYNSNYRLGLGHSNTVNVWTKLANNVKEVVHYDNSTYYISTSGELYGTGGGGKGAFGNGELSLTTWTKLAENVASVKSYSTLVTRSTAYYISTSGELYGTGGNEYAELGIKGNSRIDQWTKLADDVVALEYNGQLATYITSSGDAYEAGHTLNGLVDRWTKVGDDVARVYIDDSSNNFYLTNGGILYGRGANSSGQLGLGTTDRVSRYTQLATDVSKFYYSNGTSFYISTSGKLYGAGTNGNGQIGVSSSYDTKYWVHTDDDVEDVFRFRYATITKKQTGMYFAGTNDLFPIGSPNVSTRTWTLLTSQVLGDVAWDTLAFAGINPDEQLYAYGNYAGGAAGIDYKASNAHQVVSKNGHTLAVWGVTKELHGSGRNTNGALGGGTSGTLNGWATLYANVESTIFTNQTIVANINDQRGTVTNNVFTASANGDYLYIPVTNAVQYTYYVAEDSGLYVPDSTGQALTRVVVPDEMVDMNSNLSLTFTLQTGNHQKVYALTATATDSDMLGIAIPYDVVYTYNETVNYTTNVPHESAWKYFMETNTNPQFIKIPGLVLNGWPAYAHSGDTYYAWNERGYMTPHTVPETSGVVGVSLTFTPYSSGSDIYTVSGSGNSSVVFPIMAGDMQNATVSITQNYTPVRGNIVNGSFSADVAGNYLKLFSQNLRQESYEIGKGSTYYVSVNGALTPHIVPDTNVSPGVATVELEQSEDNENIYVIGGRTTSATTTVLIPYDIAYKERVVHKIEVIPMSDMLILMLVMIGVVSAVGLAYVKTRGGF